MNTRPMLISAAICGTLAALLSAVPVASLLNCLLCGWLWLQGIFAVWMYRYQTGEAVDSRGGMALGAVSGLFGAAVATVLAAVSGVAATSTIPADQMAQLEQMFGDAARWITSPATSLIATIVINSILYPVFGLIGGVIGASIFKNKAA